jgi:hypothetical protein
MPDIQRVTVSLPRDLLKDIDRIEKNRSKFVAAAVRREIEHHRREALRRSLQNPHPESAELAEQGLADWSGGLPEEDADALVDSSVGRSVRWEPGSGWVEEQE